MAGRPALPDRTATQVTGKNTCYSWDSTGAVGIVRQAGTADLFAGWYYGELKYREIAIVSASVVGNRDGQCAFPPNRPRPPRRQRGKTASPAVQSSTWWALKRQGIGVIAGEHACVLDSTRSGVLGWWGRGNAVIGYIVHPVPCGDLLERLR